MKTTTFGSAKCFILLQYFRGKETLLKNEVHADIEFRHNQQILDMGMPEDDIKNSFKINEHIKELENEFDFVMIEELFYESLVLLADKLCLPLEYMVEFETNAIKVSLTRA